MTQHPGLSWDPGLSLLSPSLRVHVQIVDSAQSPSPERTSDLAEWTASKGFRVLPGRTLPPMKRFFRVGTVEVNTNRFSSKSDFVSIDISLYT